jgi:DNA-binding transcriptional LysR family regulator
MELELRHLTVLTTLAEAGSVSAAARVLGVEQPNLTRQLRRIEGELGATLFRRTGAGTVMTPLGRVVVEQAQVALERVDRIRMLCRSAALAASRPTTLRMRTFGVPAERLRPSLPPHLRRDSWLVEEAAPDSALRDLRSGTADLFIGVRWPHTSWPEKAGFITLELLRAEMEVRLAEDHPLASAAPATLDEFADAAWASRPDTTTTVMECRRAGFRPKIGYTVDDPDRHLEIVRTGQVVCLSAQGFAGGPGVVARRYSRAAHAYVEMVFDPERFLPEHGEAVADAFHRLRADDPGALAVTIPA